MKITTSGNVPDSTYFRTGDAEPEINPDGSITILNGKGTFRSSWGTPGITSTVVYQDCDLVAIHVGFHHKHGGGQFWRYYTTDGVTTKQVTWPQLPDEARAKVLTNMAKAPSWAKDPGKLRSQCKKATLRTATGYKLVEVVDGSLRSLYDPRVTYTLGKRAAEAVGKNAGQEHDGGFYSHRSPDQVRALWESGDLVPDRCYRDAKTLALVECEIAGRIAEFPNGKKASTYLTPLKIVEILWYDPAQAKAA